MFSAWLVFTSNLKSQTSTWLKVKLKLVTHERPSVACAFAVECLKCAFGFILMNGNFFILMGGNPLEESISATG